MIFSKKTISYRQSGCLKLAVLKRHDEMTSPLLAFNPKGQAFAEETSTKYCQLIREANQVKRLEFNEQCL